MSETAQTLIKAALRAINAIASGETPTASEMQDGLEAMQIMLRSWSAENIMIYSVSQDTLTMTGAASYTIGSGGDANTTWPMTIRGAVVDTDYNLDIIGEARYRSLKRGGLGSTAGYLYYNPVYPLGVLYPYPTGGSSMVIDSLKALSDPATLTTSVAFPTPYDAAIKWNLALALAPEFGASPSPILAAFARDTKKTIQSKNAANQINAVDLSAIGRRGGSYDINGDVTL